MARSRSRSPGGPRAGAGGDGAGGGPRGEYHRAQTKPLPPSMRRRYVPKDQRERMAHEQTRAPPPRERADRGYPAQQDDYAYPEEPHGAGAPPPRQGRPLPREYPVYDDYGGGPPPPRRSAAAYHEPDYYDAPPPARRTYEPTHARAAPAPRTSVFNRLAPAHERAPPQQYPYEHEHERAPPQQYPYQHEHERAPPPQQQYRDSYHDAPPPRREQAPPARREQAPPTSRPTDDRELPFMRQLEVPIKYTAHLIGKKGFRIKAIRTKSRCEICNVHQEDVDGNGMFIFYAQSTSEANCINAVRIAQDYLNMIQKNEEEGWKNQKRGGDNDDDAERGELDRGQSPAHEAEEDFDGRD